MARYGCAIESRGGGPRFWTASDESHQLSMRSAVSANVKRSISPSNIPSNPRTRVRLDNLKSPYTPKQPRKMLDNLELYIATHPDSFTFFQTGLTY